MCFDNEGHVHPTVEDSGVELDTELETEITRV
jgi:hypothetical protein